eukprot:TRINITY_DN32639_c0_g1_i1.p1 TRINITY_DN32639_c0_g1~~TRINITY_DN32639_c0_g1_i1.p1  ORF type:complete len:121 (-),score=0.16 TRINITY_DN32639_c0_g1_i1:49-411(-)
MWLFQRSLCAARTTQRARALNCCAPSHRQASAALSTDPRQPCKDDCHVHVDCRAAGNVLKSHTYAHTSHTTTSAEAYPAPEIITQPYIRINNFVMRAWIALLRCARLRIQKSILIYNKQK